MNAAINQSVENICFQATNNKRLSLSDLKGKHVVLYFYPKDSTPGCTLEGRDFRDHYAEFEKFNTLIFGVSRDSLHSHERFKEKQAFPFDLISDESEALCHYFDVIKEKSMFGKKYMGIERSTFLIDDRGILCEEWRKVKVKGHVVEVLERAKVLSSSR